MQRISTLLLLISFITLPLVATTNTHNFYDITPEYSSSTSYSYDINISNTKVSTLDKRYEKLITELVYLQVFAVATIGVIAVLPEGVSNWSKEDKSFVDAQELLAKHADNIAKGPALDSDSAVINYVGHSVAGSYFYVWGRQSGLSWQESAMLTTLMSTFFWEYGWEAFAETPSTQDLIITPLLGSLLGEGTNYLYNSIVYNNDKFYDSYILGGIGKVLLNPIGEMNKYLGEVLNTANIDISVDYSYTQNIDNYRLVNTIANNGQVQSYFKLNFKLKY